MVRDGDCFVAIVGADIALVGAAHTGMQVLLQVLQYEVRHFYTTKLLWLPTHFPSLRMISRIKSFLAR
jgi:hypothetical protein